MGGSLMGVTAIISAAPPCKRAYMMSSQKLTLSQAGRVIEKHLIDDNRGRDDNNTLGKDED